MPAEADHVAVVAGQLLHQRRRLRGASPRIPSGDYAPQDNPAYRQAYRDVEVARLAAKRIGAEHLPTVDLFASYSRGLNPNLRGLTDHSDIHQSAVGVQVTIPIFSGGSVYYRQVEHAAAARSASRHQAHARPLARTRMRSVSESPASPRARADRRPPRVSCRRS